MKRPENTILALVLVSGICLVALLVYHFDRDDGASPQHERNSGSGSRPAAAAGETGDGSRDDRPVMEKEKLSSDDASTEGIGTGSGLAATVDGVISGRVVNEFGQPLLEAAVSLGSTRDLTISEGFEEVVPEKGTRNEAHCLSDAQGRFSLENVGPAPSLRLHVAHPRYVPRFVSIKAFDGKRRSLGDVILAQGGTVSGVVADPSGRPLMNATVTGRPLDREGGSSFLSFSSLIHLGSDWQAVSDASGFFRITGLPAGKADFTATHAEHPMGRTRNIAVQKGRETENVKIVLLAGKSITGRVLDSEGRPVAGASAMVEPELNFDLNDFESLETMIPDLILNLSPVTSDESGYFTIKGLEEGCYTVLIEADSFLPFRKEGVEAGTTGLKAVVQKGGWLFGRVIDAATGDGVSDFSIEAERDRDAPEILEGPEAVAAVGRDLAPQGAFYIAGIGGEPLVLRVTAEGFADERIVLQPPAPGCGKEADLELWKESVVSGRLVDFKGEPVVDGVVCLQLPGSEESGSPLPDLPDGESRSSGTVVAIGGSSGIWTDSKKTESREGGIFEMRGVAAGDYRLKASHAEHADAEPVALSVDRGVTIENLEIRLNPAGSIAGTVFDLEGAPLPGAWIHVSRGGGLTSLIGAGVTGAEPDFDMKNIRSGSDGCYRVDGLTPGRYQLRLVTVQDEESLGGLLHVSLSSMMGDGSGATTVTVHAGKVTDVDLHETRKGSITGKVLEGGSPVTGMRLKLFAGGLLAILPIKTTSSDENGSFVFEKLEEGTYNVHLELNGLPESMKETVFLEVGEKAFLDFVLPSGCVTGRITDAATGEPVAGIAVSIEAAGKGGKKKGLLESLGFQVETRVNAGGENVQNDEGDLPFGNGPRPVKTDKDGRYMIRFVKEGEYKLVVSGDEYGRKECGAVIVKAGGEPSVHDAALKK